MVAPDGLVWAVNVLEPGSLVFSVATPLAAIASPASTTTRSIAAGCDRAVRSSNARGGRTIRRGAQLGPLGPGLSSSGIWSPPVPEPSMSSSPRHDATRSKRLAVVAASTMHLRSRRNPEPGMAELIELSVRQMRWSQRAVRRNFVRWARPPDMPNARENSIVRAGQTKRRYVRVKLRNARRPTVPVGTTGLLLARAGRGARLQAPNLP